MARGRDFYSLSKIDRLLAVCGTPISYLRKEIDPSKFNFVQTAAETSAGTFIIDPKMQSKALSDVLTNLDALGGAGFYAVGSDPTEQAGYELSTFLTRAYFRYWYDQGEMVYIKWIDLGFPDWEFLKSQEPADLVVIHGLSDSVEDRRLDIAKDFIRRTEACTTIAFAVTDNILKFAVNRLHTRPEIVWQLGRTTHFNMT